MKKTKDIGFDVTMPKDSCQSVKCPWHGHLKVRGRIFSGRVVSDKPMNTAIVEWDYYRYIKKYERYQRRKSRVAAHNPICINAREGDSVKIAECRPLSKTKKFVVIEKM